MHYLISFGLEFIVGALLGFYFTDKKKGLSLREFKIGCALFLGFGAYYIWTQNVSYLLFVTLAINATVVSVGVVSGEAYHLYLLDRIKKAAQKEMMYQAVEQLIRNAKDVACRKEYANPAQLEADYRTLSGKLTELAYRAIAIHDEDLVRQLTSLSETCKSIARVASLIPNGSDESFHRFMTMADKVLEVSWKTLSEAESKLDKHLCTTWKTVSVAVKTTIVK